MTVDSDPVVFRLDPDPDFLKGQIRIRFFSMVRSGYGTASLVLGVSVTSEFPDSFSIVDQGDQKFFLQVQTKIVFCTSSLGFRVIFLPKCIRE